MFVVNGINFPSPSRVPGCPLSFHSLCVLTFAKTNSVLRYNIIATCAGQYVILYMRTIRKHGITQGHSLG